MLAEQAEARTEWLLAGQTIRACAVADAGVDHDGVAGGHREHGVAHGLHDASAVRAEYPRRRDGHARQSAQQEEVEVIQCRGAHAEAHVGRGAQLRHGKIIAKFDLLGAAVGGDGECSHASAPGLYLSRNAMRRGTCAKAR